MKQVVSVLFGVSLLVYVVYVFMPTSRCDRIHRSTIPVELVSDLTTAMARPWVENETEFYIVKNWMRFRFTANDFVRTQFFGDANEELVCAWDEYRFPDYVGEKAKSCWICGDDDEAAGAGPSKDETNVDMPDFTGEEASD